MKWGKELVHNKKGYYPIFGICMGIEFFALNAFDNGKVYFILYKLYYTIILHTICSLENIEKCCKNLLGS